MGIKSITLHPHDSQKSVTRLTKSGNTLLNMLSREIDPVRNEIGQEQGLRATKRIGLAIGSPSSGRRLAMGASRVSLELHESEV